MRAQPAEGFPDGWRFVPREPAVVRRQNDIHARFARFAILAPSGLKFLTVWSAQRSKTKGCAKLRIPGLAYKFYNHVGVLGDIDATSGVFETGLFEDNRPLSLTELRHLACTRCELCRMDDCGRCFSCVKNRRERQQKSSKRQTLLWERRVIGVCLQKVSFLSFLLEY